MKSVIAITVFAALAILISDGRTTQYGVS
jgi:hypothetical protein